MRIEKVDATAFGPLASQSLAFAPGMTVVVGRNESGKSSWHAATYAALCGRKRGVGAATKQAKLFETKHRPWRGDAWQVSAVVSLSDGRRIELRQDLDGKVDCRATDLAVGRDVSDEVMFEGSPDGSQWLGLDRNSFAATACVNQTELLRVLEHARGLQEQLQQAAATAGAADPTAAEALAAIEAFTRESVGLDRANARKPLRAAIDGLARARRRLDATRAEHEEYLRLVEDAEVKRSTARTAAKDLQSGEQRLSLVETLLEEARSAGRLRNEADRAAAEVQAQRSIQTRLSSTTKRAHELSAALGGQEPRGMADDEALVATVASALNRWTAIPGTQALTGETAHDLEARLEALPNAPEGDLQPHRIVERAASNLDVARDRAAQREAERPTPPPEVGGEVEAAMRAGAGLLRDLAGKLDAASDPGAAAIDVQRATQALDDARDAQRAEESATATALRSLEEAETQRRTSNEVLTVMKTSAQSVVPAVRPRNVPLMLLAIALGVAGAALVSSQTVLGVGFMGAGAVAAVLALRGSSSATGGSATGLDVSDDLARARAVAVEADGQASTARSQHERATARLLAVDRAVAQAEERHRSASEQVRSAQSVWSDLTSRCAVLGLPTDANQLRRLAAEAEATESARNAWQRESRLAAQDQESIEAAAAELRQALLERGVGDADVTNDSVDEVLRGYREACRVRAQQDQIAGSRSDLEQALKTRRAAEHQVEVGAVARAQALHSIAQAVRGIGQQLDASPVSEEEALPLIADLTKWQTQRRQNVAQAESAQRDWAELQALLDGGSLTDLDHRLASTRAARTRLEGASCDAEQAASTGAQSVLDLAAELGISLDGVPATDAISTIESSRATALSIRNEHKVEAARLSREAGHAEGMQEERARDLRSVPEAEETLAQAEAELARVQELSQTLETTRRFLGNAQDAVHRDIAPIIAASLQSRLPQVTEGRYTEALVDPATLGVKVRPTGGTWVEATRLSVGTAEQVYLLLRLALAEHLGSPDEPCPLLLDDVTVQADDYRTVEILDSLLALSDERQIILFAQEAEVLEWAKMRLADQEQHGIRELAQLPLG